MPRTTGEGWKLLTDRLGATVQLVGDDLFVTNTERLQRGVAHRHRQCRADQGQPDRLAHRDAGLRAVGALQQLPHDHEPSLGRDEDSFIADLAVACDCGMIKTGSASRSDRTAKYNQLLRIEEELGLSARYAGKGAFPAGKEVMASCAQA